MAQASASFDFWPAEKVPIRRLQHISSSMPNCSTCFTISRRLQGRWSTPAAVAASRKLHALAAPSTPMMRSLSIVSKVFCFWSSMPSHCTSYTNLPCCLLRLTTAPTSFPYLPCTAAFSLRVLRSSSSLGSIKCLWASSSQPFWKRCDRYVKGVDSYHLPSETMWCCAMKESRKLWCCHTSPIFPSCSVGLSSPHMRPKSVDLPAPFTPTRATRLPRLSLAVMPLITRPLPPGYSKKQSRISITGLELLRMPSSFPGIGKTSFTAAAFGSSRTTESGAASPPSASAPLAPVAPSPPSAESSGPFAAAARSLSMERFPARSTSASSSEIAFACLNASKLPL
mmetsp:Transcript_47143/g.131582  ORF Transcript_47143/g.131582 Transcript_47143/m.131582 type:complete len:340 (-) Transcript_47143:2649-3668(-)